MQTSQIGAIGIDFGSQRSVIAVAKKGGVEVIANEASHRETANYIGFSQNERFIGEQGALQSKSNFKNTVSFFNRFLGLYGRPPFLREETKWLSVSNQVNENGKFLFNVNYEGKPHQFTSEQLTASMLNKLKDIINKNQINFSSSNSVISVPSYYTDSERKALLDACKIAEFPVDRLLNETTAIAVSYGLFRKQELDQTVPRYVAFVDMGHSKTSAFVASFTKEKASIIAQVNDRNLGARDLDWTTFIKYCDIFEQQSGGLNPMENKKSSLRLLDAIEKQRKVLSSNNDSNINVEYLVEDVDFNHNMNREQYVKMIEPTLNRLQQLLEFLMVQVQNQKIKLHSIEVVGGATRIPSIQQIIQSTLGIDQVSRTLNASECIARGCAMIAATKNPSFRVTEYHIDDANFYPIRVGWLYGSTLQQTLKQSNMDIEGTTLTNFFPEKQRPLLFDNNCSIPSLKSFNLTRTENVEVTIFYDPVPPGFQPIIQQINIPAVKPKHPEFYSKIRIRLDQNGLTHLEDVALIEEFQEEYKVPKEKPKDATVKDNANVKDESQPQQQQQPEQTGQKMQEEKVEQEFETKKRKKQISSNITSEATNLYVLSQKEIQNYFEIESTMINLDKLTHETYQRKNELESYIYTNKSNISSTHKDFIPVQEQEKIRKELDAQYEWLYDEGVKATRSQYTQRLDLIKALCEPYNKRYKDFKDTPDFLNLLLQYIEQVEKFTLTQDEQYAHITLEERQKVKDICKLARQWVHDNLALIAKSDKLKDLQITQAQINTYQNDFRQKTQQIMTRPKPQPPKEDVKADSPQPEQAQNQEPKQKMETE